MLLLLSKFGFVGCVSTSSGLDSEEGTTRHIVSRTKGKQTMSTGF